MYDYMQNGFPYGGAPWGGMPQPSFRVPKYQVYDAIALYVMQSTGVGVKQMQKIKEAPDAFRHSCVQTGITILQRNVYRLQSGGTIVQIPFYFCTSCGKLFIFSEFET